MPWIYLPKKPHRCRIPFGIFKRLGSRWECPECESIYVKTADMHGSYMAKED